MPAIQDIHVDQMLMDMAIGPRRNRGYIADEVYPVKQVRKQSDLILDVDPKATALRTVQTKIAPGARPKSVDFTIDKTRTYFCEKHGLEASVTDEEMANADAPVTAFLNKGEYLLEMLALEKEIALVTNIAASFTGSNTSAPGTVWSNYSASDPYTDISAKIDSVADASGARPNRMAMDHKVARIIANHPDILDRIRFTNGGVIPNMDAVGELLARVFMLDKIVLTGDVFKNTAAMEATPSFSRIWGVYAFLYRFEPPAIGTRTTGVHFVWNGVLREGTVVQQGFNVRTFRAEGTDSDVVQARWFYDQITLLGTASGAPAGHLFHTTV